MLIIIDNYDSFTYNLYQCLADKIDTRVFRNDKISIEQIAKLNPSGIVLSPGPGRPEQAGICVELVKELSNQIPILGICLGHQAIAQAFGGNVVQHAKIVHGKQSQVHHLENPLFRKVPSQFAAGRYHSLVVELDTLPADLLVTAICDGNTIMALQHVKRPCYGIQFHPESVLTPKGTEILNNFVDICQMEQQHAHSINQKTYAA